MSEDSQVTRYIEEVKKALCQEHGREVTEAEQLIQSHPQIVAKGHKSVSFDPLSTARALELKARKRNREPG